MQYSLCIDLLYLEITERGPIFSDTGKLLNGMELAKKTGYKAVEFWDWDTRDHEALLAKKRELDLDVIAMCLKETSTLIDASKLDRTVQNLKETVKIAKKFGCSNIILRADPDDRFDRDTAKQNIIEGLKRLAPIAEEAGMILVLEPVSRGHFVDLEEPLKILRAVGSDNVKLLYDIFHYQLMRGNIVSSIKENIDLIGHIHMASVPNRNEITDGELNYKYILGEIQKANYDKYVGLEYLPTMDKEESVIKCKTLLDEILI